MSSSRGLLIGGAGLLALGGGGYYAVQMSTISGFENEVSSVKKMLDGEKKKAENIKSSIASTEQLIVSLGKKEGEQRKALKTAEVNLEEARKALAQQEAAFKKAEEAVLQTAKDSLSAVSKLSNLRTEGERAREALTLGEKSLAIAKAQSAEAKKLLNPLNHPKVAQLMGRK